jgi:peptidoglycan/LPS O-acetylase OafA/YrhL
LAGSAAIAGVAIWSAIAGRRSGGRTDHRFAVDRAVLAVLGLVAAAGVVGIALLMSGSRPLDPLHLVYGPAALVCLPVAIWIGTRVPAGGGSRLRRDVWTAGGGIVLLGLALRLFATG